MESAVDQRLHNDENLLSSKLSTGSAHYAAKPGAFRLDRPGPRFRIPGLQGLQTRRSRRWQSMGAKKSGKCPPPSQRGRELKGGRSRDFVIYLFLCFGFIRIF